jgi:PAS domain S-box-containing protein
MAETRDPTRDPSVAAPPVPAPEHVYPMERFARLPLAARVGLALGIVAAGVATRAALTPLLGFDSPYLTVIPAVVVAALLAGPLPAIAAAAAGAAAVEVWVVAPQDALAVSPRHLLRPVLVLGAATLVAWVAGRSRRAQLSLRRAIHDLRAAARARSAALAGLRRANADLEAARARARASEAILAQAGEMAGLGAWWLDLRDPAHPEAAPVCWSDEVYRIFGYPPGSVTPSFALALSHVPEDDQPRLLAAARAVATGEQPPTVEHRLRRADGALRTVVERSHLVVNAGGVPIRLVGSVQDVTELKQAEQALRDADRHKNEFLAMLSHELRNPLAPIRNSVFVLEHGEPGSAAARRAVEVIGRQAEHLAHLVDELLDVTRIARGKVELHLTEVDLVGVVRSCAEDLRTTIEERGLALSVDVPPGPLAVTGDPTRLAQVVGNLLHNATKFTPRGGAVALSLSAAGGRAEIRVRDTGEGIAPDLLARVFEPFVQAERSLARSQGGLGLGLALVRGIAELHGGTARADSAGRGQGTTVTVSLPLAGDAAVDPGPRRAPRTSSSVS